MLSGTGIAGDILMVRKQSAFERSRPDDDVNLKVDHVVLIMVT